MRSGPVHVGDVILFIPGLKLRHKSTLPWLGRFKGVESVVLSGFSMVYLRDMSPETFSNPPTAYLELDQEPRSMLTYAPRACVCVCV